MSASASIPPYPADRWPNDFRHTLEVVAKFERQRQLPHLLAHMVRVYGRESFSFENYNRMLRCLDYFEAHTTEWAQEHLADFHADRSRISPHLIAALYRVFASITPERVATELPVAKIVDLAEEQRRLYPDME
jgi:hypothetical protein